MDSLCLRNTFSLNPNLNFQILIQRMDNRLCSVSFLRGSITFTHDNQFFILPMFMKWLTCKTYVREVVGTVLAGYGRRLNKTFHGFLHSLQVWLSTLCLDRLLVSHSSEYATIFTCWLTVMWMAEISGQWHKFHGVSISCQNVVLHCGNTKLKDPICVIAE
jgi:hypothetical protein